MADSSSSSSSSYPEIKINASQVASAIGRHPYKNRDETLNKVWRLSDIRTYFIGNALEHEEDVVEIVQRHWKNASGEAFEDLSEILFEDWEKQEYTLVQLLKVLFPEHGCLKRLSLAVLQRDIRDLVLSQTDSDFRDNRELQEAKVTREDLQIEVKKLKNDEKRPVSKSLNEICEKKDIKDEGTKKIIQGQLNKKRGIALESNAITKFEKLKHVKVQIVPELFEKEMEYEGITWILRGQIDGKIVKNKKDKVIEVKNRTERYMRPEYDKIQLQSYMFLCDKQEGSLVEHLKGNQRETVMPFQQDEWNDTVTPALKEAMFKVKNQIESYQLLLNSCPDFQFTSRHEELECKKDENEMVQ